MSPQRKKEVTASTFFKILGIFILALGIIIFLKIYFPVAKEEVVYRFTSHSPASQSTSPIDPEFSIVIPRLGINTKVIKNVDPYNSSEYQVALTHGVAHAKGSALPGFSGNIFIFAHSAADLFQANRFNAVFYLINKLEAGDSIDLYFQSSKYTYTVSDKKIVKGSDLNYLTDNSVNKQSLTLMTCWPPGTTLNRLIILANRP